MANKILICDDDQIITDSLSEYLSAMDYEILAVNDGNEAIENFLSYNPDLVLLDIMMPRLNGLDVIKRKDIKPKIIISWKTMVKIRYSLGCFFEVKENMKIKKTKTSNHKSKLPSWFPQAPDIL